MPRLPEFQRAPLPGRRAASGADFGSQVADAGAPLAQPLRDLGEVSTRISAARESARASRISAQFSVGAESAFQEAVDSGAPPEQIEGLVVESLRKRREEAAEPLSGGWRTRFDAEAEMTQARTLARVRNFVRDEQIKLGKQDTMETLKISAEQAAGALGDDLERLNAEAATVVGRAEGAGLYSPAEAAEALRGYREAVASAATQRYLNDDPQAGLALLQEKAGPFEEMGEEARQRAIRAMNGQIKQNASFARARESEARAEEARQRKELQDTTRKDGLLMAARGELTVDWIEQNQGNLDPSAMSQLLDDVRRADADARKRAGTPDPVSYFELRKLQATDPGAFAQAEIDPGAVGYENAAKLIEEQQAIRKGAGETPSGLTGRLKRWTDGIKASSDETAELYRIGEERILAFQRETGRTATDAEQQRILDGVLLERVRARPRGPFGIFGTDTEIAAPGTPIDPAQLPQIPGVPDAAARKLVEYITQRGGSATISRIRAMYARPEVRESLK